MAGQIEALLHELERHILGGRVERAAAIKRELAALGHAVDEPPAAAPESTAVASQPETTAAPVAGDVSTADAPAPAEATTAPSVGA